jgi:hypothetical protein
MITYQDYIRDYGENPDAESVGKFLQKVVSQHKTSDEYKNADMGYRYYLSNNDMGQHINYLVTATGEFKQNPWSPNNTTTSGIFRELVDEEVAYLLGNGVNWGKEDTNDKLGKRFDDKLFEAAKAAIWGGKSFTYPLGDEVKTMTLREYVPIYDEETGTMRAGVYFYQIDDVHPITYTFFEEDGISVYIQTNGAISVKEQKTPYVIRRTPGAGANATIDEGIPVKRLPVIQYNGNTEKRSELLPIKKKIDAKDKILNGFINDLDEPDLYWIIENASASTNEDLAKFLDQLKAMHAAVLEGETKITPVTVDLPYQARTELLSLLDKAIKADFRGLDLDNIISGSNTATQIKAAYTPLKIKATDFEACTRNFLYDLLDILGIDDKPTFDPDPLINSTEEINNIISAYGAALIPQDYATRKILGYLGDKDKADEVLQQMAADDLARMTGFGDQGEGATDDNNNNDE